MEYICWPAFSCSDNYPAGDSRNNTFEMRWYKTYGTREDGAPRSVGCPNDPKSVWERMRGYVEGTPEEKKDPDEDTPPTPPPPKLPPPDDDDEGGDDPPQLPQVTIRPVKESYHEAYAEEWKDQIGAPVPNTADFTITAEGRSADYTVALTSDGRRQTVTVPKGTGDWSQQFTFTYQLDFDEGRRFSVEARALGQVTWELVGTTSVWVVNC